MKGCAVLVLALAVSAVSGAGSASEDAVSGDAVALALNSPFFRNNSRLPAYFTCDGPNIAPAVRWRLPPGGRSAALMLEEVSSGDVHWVAWDLEGEGLELEQTPRREGMSSFKGTAGYRGPCPSNRSAEHTYRLTVVAADVSYLTDGSGHEAEVLKRMSTWSDVEQALTGHEVGRASLVFTYQRGEPQLTLPPRLPEVAGDSVKGNPRLSKRFSPDLL